MIASVDGRIGPLVTTRETVRIGFPARERSAVLQGASSRELLSAPDIWNHRIDSDANWVEVKAPTSGDVLWRIVQDGDNEADAEVSVLRRAPQRLGEFLTHPDWLGDEKPTGSYRFATTLAVRPAERVRLLIAAAGVLSVTVDGHEIGPLLAPGVADFRKEVPAAAFDLTNAITDEIGDIAIEIAPGPSWVRAKSGRYSKLDYEGAPLSFSACIILGEGATARTIAADQSWEARPGASTFTSWYGGEEFVGSNREGEATSPVVVGDAGLPLWWPEHPGARVIESLAPVAVSEPSAGTRVFDLGRNIAGRPRVRVPGDGGGRLTIWPAELTDESGHITQWSTGGPIFHSVRVETTETWAPRFMYSGFRFLQVETESGSLPGVDDVHADVIRVANNSTGSFGSTNGFISTLHELVVRAVEGNSHSMFTDCPHREKLGWLEQMHLCFTTLARNFDVEAHMRDALHHMRVAQLPSGAVPSTTPDFADFSGIEFRGDPDAFRHDPNWGRAIVSTTWKHYQEYGDPRVLTENVEAIDRYLAYLASRSSGDLVDFGLGDWIGLDHSSSRALLASHGYHAALRDGAAIHAALGDTPRAAMLDEQAENVRHAILKRFWPRRRATQAELAILLDLALPPQQEELFDALLDRLDNDGGRITVGEIGLPAFVSAFSRAGQDATLLRLFEQPDVPGYGLQIARGATSLTENWTLESGPEGEGSQNHFMLGMVDDWITEVVGGLSQHPESVAWERATVRPLMDDSVGDAAVSYRSVRGEWGVAWNAGEGWVDVTVPPTGRAEVELPSGWTFESGAADCVQEPGQVRYTLRRVHTLESRGGVN